MENAGLPERYELSMERIREFKNEDTVKEPYRDYFVSVAEFIDLCAKIMDETLEGNAAEDTEALAERNRALYKDILPGNYETSYADPAYSADIFGEVLGKLFSFLYTEIRGDIVYSAEGRLLEMTVLNEAFIEIYDLFEEDELPEDAEVRDVLYWCMSDYCDMFISARLTETLDPSCGIAKKIIMESDLTDLTYLYRYGEYISDEELTTAAFLNSLPEETIKLMADTFTDGYIRGFKVMGVDLSKKKNVQVRYHLGFERTIRQAAKNFEAAGLSVIFTRAATDSINRNPMGKIGYVSSSPNRQYDYDHRYDSALYLDKKFNNRKIAALRAAYKKYAGKATDYAGPACVDTFGEEGFSPVNKPEVWAFTDEQQKLYLDYRNASAQIQNEYIPGNETSFTIIAFPMPAIGPDFEEIFKETVNINTLDYVLYQKIQQKLVDVLDTAEFIEIKGRGDNKTSMRVHLADLEDPKTQSKFENCTADVNIPLGEVFTSPVLKGTEGTLNVSSVFIENLQFKNLTVEFKDGWVTDYSCDNFTEKLPPDASAEERKEAYEAGRKLIVQGIMNNHVSLPIGECAIGTNTTAYAMAEKFGILDRLPILIAEKMGPHFALGDTCYNWSEDNPVYNPNGKEMIARDNEVSILRKTDVSKAYFGVHTDITLPYKELGSIEAVRPDGSCVTILADGRFALEGLEELNEALDNI